MRPGIEPATSWFLGGFVSTATTGTPVINIVMNLWMDLRRIDIFTLFCFFTSPMAHGNSGARDHIPAAAATYATAVAMLNP